MAKTGLLTYANVERFPDDGNRYEIIGGDLFVTPPPRLSHQDAVSAIIIAFMTHASETGGWAYVAPTGLYFDERDFVEPDVMYIASDRLHIIADDLLRGAPTIVVEVLSPSTERTDRERKRRLYAQFGVLEYWIVDIQTRSVEVLTEPQGDDFCKRLRLTEGAVRSSASPGLAVQIDRIFAKPPRTP